MPDIAMCSNSELCPKKASCVRATATPDRYEQSYTNFYIKGETCEYYYKSYINRGGKDGS
jgi:hypothetical protein